MSDDLVARLRAQATVLAEDHPAVPTWVLDSLSEAADRIEQLEAERDTLAEMVRLLNMSVESYAEGSTIWWFTTDAGELALTLDQAERFRQVLDRITKGDPS